MLLAAVVTAFIAFTGVATLVPGGPRRAGRRGGRRRDAEPGLARRPRVDDALIALLLGYRLAVLRYGTAADAARSALTYAIVVAVAAGATRAIDVPRLLGPAVLTLVFYLWDALHGTAPARRREPGSCGSWACCSCSARWSSRGTSSCAADRGRPRVLTARAVEC